MSAKRVLLSVINDMSADRRVHKIACTLVEAGYEVCVVGRRLPDSQPLGQRPYAVVRLPSRFRRGKLMYAEFTLRLFFFLLTRRADIYTANDLDTLLPNFIVARLRGARLVYDSHEFFTEVPELVDRSLTRGIWLTLERLLFPRLKHISAVSESIAAEYRKLYGRPVVVVCNAPPYAAEIPFALKENIILYQGAVNVGRGVDLALAALRHLPHCKLWVAGKGDVLDDMKRLAEELGVAERTTFWGQIPLEKLDALTRQAKIGLSIEEDLGLNYRYAAPNKVFDYIQSRLPVIVSDLPEMRNIVETYGVGEILPVRDAQALASLIQNIFANPERYENYRKKTEIAARELCWEREQDKLLSLYRDG